MFNTTKKSHGISADALSYWSLLALAALLPLYAFVSASIPPMMSKVYLASVLVLVALVFFSIARMRAQEVTLPKSLLLAVAWLLPLAYLLSTLFVPEGIVSVFGERLPMDSGAFMLICAFALTLTALVITTPSRALGVYVTMLGSAIVLSIFELILFFARESVAATGIVLPSLSLLGTLNDLGVFFGLITIFILLSLILLPLTQLVRGVLWAGLVVTSFFLTMINLTVLWWILGVFALATFVYSVSTPYFTKGVTAASSISVASLAVLVLSSVFLFAGDSFTGAPAKWANVGELDVRPSWQTTASLGREVLKDNMLFGSGPGSFDRVWARGMPPEINQTAFWLADFEYGIGLIPTAVITTGLLGAFAWLVFLVVFLWAGVRVFLMSQGTERNDINFYLRVTSFFGALFLWIIAFIQVPSPVLTVYAFVLTGLFVATLSFGSDMVKIVRVQFRENARIGFTVTLLFTFSVLMSIGGLYSFSTHYVAEASYQHALRVLTEKGDLDEGQRLLEGAIGLAPNDAYYRLMSNIGLVRIQQLLAQNKSPEEVRQPLQDLLAQSIANAQKATELDKNDYQNWVNLGSIYQSIVPLGIEGSIDSAMSAFDRSLELRPSSPLVLLGKATLERARGNTEAARSSVEQAITLRNQYTDAIFLLAQMQLEQNDTANAIKSVEAVTLFEPQNPVAYFQLGLLKYGTNDFVGAVQSLERAVALNNVYANAYYFLGLSYWRLGDNQKALAQFQKVRETNPDNVEVKAIIANLEQNKDPFQQTTPTQDIQAREGLPVEGANEVDQETPTAEAAQLAE